MITSVAELKIMQAQLEGRALQLEVMNEELRVHDRAQDSALSQGAYHPSAPLTTSLAGALITPRSMSLRA